jgi:hypothetical protein
MNAAASERGIQYMMEQQALDKSMQGPYTVIGVCLIPTLVSEAMMIDACSHAGNLSTE